MSPPNRVIEVHSFTVLIVPHLQIILKYWKDLKYIDEYKVLHFHAALLVEQLS